MSEELNKLHKAIEEIKSNQINMRKDISIINESINKLIEVQYELVKINEIIKYINEKQKSIDSDRVNGCNYSKVLNERVKDIDKRISTTNKTLLGVATAAIVALIRSLF